MSKAVRKSEKVCRVIEPRTFCKVVLKYVVGHRSSTKGVQRSIIASIDYPITCRISLVTDLHKEQLKVNRIIRLSYHLSRSVDRNRYFRKLGKERLHFECLSDVDVIWGMNVLPQFKMTVLVELMLVCFSWSFPVGKYEIFSRYSEDLICNSCWKLWKGSAVKM